jgi:HEAT repeat protein
MRFESRAHCNGRGGNSPAVAFFRALALAVALAGPAPIASAERAKPAVDVERLGALLADETRPERARIRVARTLAESPDPKALSYLFEAIADASTAAEIRAAYARALGRSPQRQPAAAFLRQRLGDSREAPAVRAAAATGLGALGLPEHKAVLRDASSDADPAVRLAASSALLALSGADVDRATVLGAILADREQSGNARAGAAQQLGALKDPRALPILRAALAEALPSLPKPATPAEALEMAGILKRQVPLAAARALGELDDPAAGAALLEYSKDREPEMRLAVFESLARLKADEAVPAARAAVLDDDDYRVRRWAAVLLKETRATEALSELRRAFEKDPDPGVRLQAVQALEVLQDQEAAVLIRAALPKEELKELRAAMEHALTSLAGSAAGAQKTN